MSTYVPFDPDFAAIGYIEPVFVEEVVGYYTERIVLDETPIAIWCDGAGAPTMMKSHREWLPTPEPNVKPILRWRKV